MTMISRREALLFAGGLILVRPSLAIAAEHGVEMLNKHPENSKQRNVFLPRILSVQPGDTVTFISIDRGHNSASIKGMLPEGAEAWNGKISKDIAVTFDTPGYYGYQCTPHYALGMVGLIIVEGEGKLANLDAAKAVKHRGRARKEFEAIWAEAESSGLLS